MADELSRQSDNPVGPVDNATASPEDPDFGLSFELHTNRSNPVKPGTSRSDIKSAVLPTVSIDGHAPSQKSSHQPAENKSTNDAQHPLPAIQLRPANSDHSISQTLSPKLLPLGSDLQEAFKTQDLTKLLAGLLLF